MKKLNCSIHIEMFSDGETVFSISDHEAKLVRQDKSSELIKNPQFHHLNLLEAIDKLKFCLLKAYYKQKDYDK